jgi:hypothetical protein
MGWEERRERAFFCTGYHIAFGDTSTRYCHCYENYSFPLAAFKHDMNFCLFLPTHVCASLIRSPKISRQPHKYQSLDNSLTDSTHHSSPSLEQTIATAQCTKLCTPASTLRLVYPWSSILPQQSPNGVLSVVSVPILNRIFPLTTQPLLPARARLTVARPLARPTPLPLVPLERNMGAFLSMSGTMKKRTWLPRM